MNAFNRILVNPIKVNLNMAGVPEDEHDRCMSWALGEFWGTQKCIDATGIWVGLHPDLPFIRGDMRFNDGICFMGEQYLIHNKIKEGK